MNLKPALQAVVAASALCTGLSAASDAADGAMLRFKVSSHSIAPDGVVDNTSVESAVLVAFNERFATQQRGLRVELLAADAPPAADVTVAVYDLRGGASPKLIGTKVLSVPAGDSKSTRLTGTDGTSYDVSVQFTRATLPAKQP